MLRFKRLGLRDDPTVATVMALTTTASVAVALVVALNVALLALTHTGQG